MERCPVRIALAAACLCLAAASPGCNALGLGKGKDAQSDQAPFYDEFFGQDDPPISSSVPEDEAPTRLFKRNRLPGGLSSEAREIERGSFNIY
ncbi:hypothetical protein [Tautonia sociabilis]|uniref:Uncharacterized protein n=1 Tax=Tautonia sociabilis TaxID=2080755 RepID=A0A432MHJ4_9BACT|nr:hypothetical protein [Tautonia sociabilis]RUL86293.1 hypothetical protein TsocGM_16305 [Tautonia sociabilis]